MEENPFLFKFHSIHMEQPVLYNILKTKTKLLVFSRSLFFLEEVTRRNMFLQMVVIDHKKDIIEWFKRHLIGEQVNCVVSINNMSSNCRLTWKNKSFISNNFFLFSSKKINAKWDKENKIKSLDKSRYYYYCSKVDELFILRFYPHHCLSFIEYMCSHFLQIYYILRNLKKVLFKKKIIILSFFKSSLLRLF